jgi:hypothetical protein
VTSKDISLTVLDEVNGLIPIVFTHPWDESKSQCLVFDDSWFFNNRNLVDKEPEEFLERVWSIGIFKISVMITRNDIHSNAEISERFEKMLSIMVETFDIDCFSIVIVVT